LRDVEAEFAQQAARGVDAVGARRHPAGADPAQALKALPALGLRRRRQDAAAAAGPGKAAASARSALSRRA
jgi:hypothetical protein